MNHPWLLVCGAFIVGFYVTELAHAAITKTNAAQPFKVIAAIGFALIAAAFAF